ncbi:MAG: prepilin-type N-terminal cleavage/methylation domain-containing protein [Magnetococcales bacterium]|nr:prepilin-type N-terminal cleavage/methylation domain-containing protein [Magnetococcales bacterium]
MRMRSSSPPMPAHRAAEGGFTLIELIMVIVILGILAAVAIPRFTDLSSDARAASIQGVAGGIASANATNVAVCSISSTNANCVTVDNCQDGFALLEGGATTMAGYAITSGAVTSGGSTTCTVYDTASTTVTATFTITGVP